MKHSRKNKGITLISLVITIIILLILAGISIAMLTGENGVLTKAKNAVEKNEYGKSEEKVKLAVMEYHANMKEKTMYSILTNIEGFEGISPEDESAGMPYDVIVDGYIFTVTDTGIEYKGKSNGIKPEIISIDVTKINDKESKIMVQAKTEDANGIEKVIVVKNGIKIDEKEVIGTNIATNFNVKGNGTYKVIIIGKNSVRAESEALEVTGLISLSGIISAGSVIDGGVLLTITCESTDNAIKNIELYESQTKIGEIPIEEPIITTEKTYQIDYIPFFEEKNYFAKIISTDNQEVLTNTVKASNQNSIKTKEDLTKFASLVSGGNSFYSKTIKLISNIDSIGNFQAIGHGLEEGNGFDGTFDGNYNVLSDITINATDTNLGFFAELQSHATIKNLILKNCSISNNYPAKGYNVLIGGIAGLNYGKIENCAYIGSLTYNRKYIYNSGYDIAESPVVGGTCSLSIGGDIANCVFIGNISVSGATPAVGGIIGELSSDGICHGCYSVGSVSIPYCEYNPRCGGIVGEDFRDGNNNQMAVYHCINQSQVSSMEAGYTFSAGISGLVSYYNSRYAPDASGAKNWDLLNHEIGYYYRAGCHVPHDGESTGCKPPSTSLEEVAKQAGVESEVTTDSSRKTHYYAFLVCKNKR